MNKMEINGSTGTNQSQSGDAEVIGLVTGSFDLLHCGHLHLWRQAAQHCDKLLIGLESDERIRVAKGVSRPLYSVDLREKRVNQAFPEGTTIRLPNDFFALNVRQKFLLENKVQVLIVGRDDNRLTQKRAEITAIGGQLIVVDFAEIISMTKILRGEQSSAYLLFKEDEKWLK